MYDTVSVAESKGLDVELLPARTVLSLFGQLPIGDASTSSSSGSGSGKGFSPMSMLGLMGSHGAPGANADGSNGTENS